jgi:hypothetical protein
VGQAKGDKESKRQKMATHNIVVFGGDHCGPEVSSVPLRGSIVAVQAQTN